MRYARVVDRLLLAAFLPAVVAVHGLALRDHRAHGSWQPPFVTSASDGPDGHPTVVAVPRGPSAAVEPGDQLLRIGTTELRGADRPDVIRELLNHAGRGPVEVAVSRAGRVHESSVELIRDRFWWTYLIPAAGLVGAALFLLLRAPHWHLARRFFVGSMLWVLIAARTGAVELGFVLSEIVQPLAIGFAVWNAFELTEAARPLRPWQRIAPWLLALAQAGLLLAWDRTWLSLGPSALQGIWIGYAAMLLLMLLGVTRAYRRADPLERRQVKWIVLGFYVAFLPQLLFNAALLVGLPWSFVAEQLMILPSTAISVGFVVAIAGYRWLDIDRLISATASYSLLGVALLGAAFALVPPLGRALAAAAGVDATAGHIAVSIAVATVLVRAERSLRPRVDRWLFAEQHAVAEGFERLRADLPRHQNVEELARHAGEGIDALLRPEAIATYARSGDSFAPIFVRGRGALPAFAAQSSLVHVLEGRSAPLVARAKAIGPFDRAALETLGAEAVVPIRRSGVLAAFTCLGAKRSGDVYTPTELALLASLADRCAELLARRDTEAVQREAKAVQSALRRYVPGVVAERVLRGEALPPAEREVTVLFVDIRNYVRFAAEHSAADVFATLDAHTERVSSIVNELGGSVVEFNGDGLMAVFGAPDPLPRKEHNAVEAARRIVDELPAHLAVGVGIATGEAFVGSIRAADRLIWTAVGNTTNLAARLQDLTRDLDAVVAIDARTRERARYVCADFESRPAVSIRGRVERIDLFVLRARAPAPAAAIEPRRRMPLPDASS
jgi:class 3 adenylate cyclase